MKEVFTNITIKQENIMIIKAPPPPGEGGGANVLMGYQIRLKYMYMNAEINIQRSFL